MNGDLQRALGMNLRRIRADMGMSQEAFAESVGVHRTYMGGLERGERNVTLKVVERIADVIGMDPLDLLRDPWRSTEPPVLPGVPVKTTLRFEQ